MYGKSPTMPAVFTWLKSRDCLVLRTLSYDCGYEHLLFQRLSIE